MVRFLYNQVQKVRVSTLCEKTGAFFLYITSVFCRKGEVQPSLLGCLSLLSVVVNRRQYDSNDFIVS